MRLYEERDSHLYQSWENIKKYSKTVLHGLSLTSCHLGYGKGKEKESNMLTLGSLDINLGTSHQPSANGAVFHVLV